MQKGVWWLITVWSGFAIIATAHKIDSSNVRVTSEAIKMVNDLSHENANQQQMLQAQPLSRNDIGGLYLGACGLEKFWHALGPAHADLRTYTCGMNTVLS